MTLTALKKEVLRLPVAQRIKLANAVFESLPSHRKALSFEELDKRADEALSGSVKMISAEQFDRETEELLNKLARQRRKS
ncbi:MAG: addiction module protein [Methylacidiphilales bacterium]|nr:addiction module protein [Candidatus Methylacidiphilales bacterium]